MLWVKARLWGLEEPLHFIDKDPREAADLLAATQDTAGTPGPRA